MTTQSPLEILVAERERRIEAFAADIASLDAAIASLRGPLKIRVDGGSSIKELQAVTSRQEPVPGPGPTLVPASDAVPPSTEHYNHVHYGAQEGGQQQPAQAQPQQPAPQQPQAQQPAQAPQAAVQAPAAEDPDADAPWSNPAQAPASPAGEGGAAPTGRRKNEDIARDLGITLDEVREWKKANNHENPRVTKGDIETAAAVKHATIGQTVAHEQQQPAQQQQQVQAPQGEVQFAPMEGVQAYQTEAYPQQQAQPQFAPAQQQPQMAPQVQSQVQPGPAQPQAPQFAQQQQYAAPQAPQGGQPQFVAPVPGGVVY